MTQTEIDRIIFTYNQNQLLELSKNGKQLYDSYIENSIFQDNISLFIIEMGREIGMDINDERLKSIIRHYKKMDDCDEIQLCNLITKFNSYAELLNKCKMLDKQSILYIADSLVLVSEYNIYKEKNNIPFDKEIRNYKTIQRFCSFYALSYDAEAMINKLKKLKEQ